LYVVKNPTLPISQTILTTLGIDTSTDTQGTWMDISNCISYFDGCNTCMVSGGVIGGCTRMYCEQPTQAKCLEYISTGTTNTEIDLSNCVSYFDGCNNCTVKDGKADACTLMYCETPSQPKCTQYATGTKQPTADTKPVGIANPASVNCEKKWGTVEIKDSASGQYGICHLANGQTCEERAYFRGECGGTGTTQSAICTMEYAPVCASVQVECIKAPCPPINETFGNRCMMKANKKATFLYNGECKTK